MTLHVLGVRHHSPACARWVQQKLAEIRPRWILIEGPSDMNDRVGELGLDHQLPVALFSFHYDEDRRHSSWYPFCVHSPEWLALQFGLETQAEVRFIDLPAWALGGEALENQYADRKGTKDYLSTLETASGEYGYDAIWDRFFELSPRESLEQRLETYFDGLREVEPVRPSDLQREAFMRDYVAWACQQNGDVVVICGGFHAPVLRQATSQTTLSEPKPPQPTKTARAATWLVPYSQKKMDSFAGYSAGLPSPAWYRWAWEREKDPAAKALEETSQRLRAKGVQISVADTVAAWTQAKALADLRGHASIARTDFLDAIVSTWIKEPLEHPLPWSQRQVLQPGTHPVLVEVVDVLCGDLRGALAAETPLPPLAHHVQKVLKDLDLEPSGDGPREVALFPGEKSSSEKVQTLERLLLLGIAGYSRASLPGKSPRRFQIGRHDDFESTLLEAAAYGPDLEAAALAVLEERATTATGLVQLVQLLKAALLAGLPRMSERALRSLKGTIEEESNFNILGQGLRDMTSMLRHDGLRELDRHFLLELVESAVSRGLWLMEGIRGSGPFSMDRVDTVVALRNALKKLANADAGVSTHARSVFSRMAHHPHGPFELVGAALGVLVSLDILDPSKGCDLAIEAIGTMDTLSLGDYFVGLVTLAREVLASDRRLLLGLDQAIQAMNEHEFALALPSLRLAFQRLPSPERARFAEQIAGHHGGNTHGLLARLEADPQALAYAALLEEETAVFLQKVGLYV